MIQFQRKLRRFKSIRFDFLRRRKRGGKRGRKRGRIRGRSRIRGSRIRRVIIGRVCVGQKNGWIRVGRVVIERGGIVQIIKKGWRMVGVAKFLKKSIVGRIIGMIRVNVVIVAVVIVVGGLIKKVLIKSFQKMFCFPFFFERFIIS